MVKSMTGFGQARGGEAPLVWNVEIRSWNHRFFECSARLPSLLNGLEDRVRDFVHSRVKRGKIAVSVSFRNGSIKNKLSLDDAQIDFYLRAIKRIQKKYRLKDELSINALLSIPHIFTTNAKEELSESDWSKLSFVMGKALKRLIEAKVKEGFALSRDLKNRLRLIDRSLEQIGRIEKATPRKRLTRLKKRIQKLTENVVVDPKRLEQEIVLSVDRGDITEELVRAKHHIATFERSLSESGEIGKKLDFLAQELHREINTIGSKAQDSAVADEVVRIKSELEKIREQVQNVE